MSRLSRRSALRGSVGLLTRRAIQSAIIPHLPLKNLAEMYNPYIRGWINYYGHFYRTQLRSTLERIDAYVVRWARRKFK
jgi:hypothetical protein